MRNATALIVLALLCGSAAPLRGQPAVAPDNTFDVRRFGATGERAEKATRAIQNAIDACFRAGGGVVYVPPGQYTTGAIELKDNVNLQLEAGATLFLSQDRADFAGRRSMVYARGPKNIAVTGRGTLDGLAQYEWTEARGQDPQIARETEIARQAGVDDLVSHARGAGTRDIRLRNNELGAACKNVEFETRALKKALVADR